MNLLTNAIKNTPPNGEISVNLTKNEDYAIIEVIDTGIGLTENEMEILFTRFGKIERYGEGLEYINIQGSGLGLYISKEIVDLHEGVIQAESEGRDKGSKFIVKLPL
jgi:signal transduction histidine kinase